MRRRGSWRVPAVLVDYDVLDSDYVLEAVLTYGRRFKQVTAMRKAHRTWAREVLAERLKDASIEVVDEAERLLGRRSTF